MRVFQGPQELWKHLGSFPIACLAYIFSTFPKYTCGDVTLVNLIRVFFTLVMQESGNQSRAISPLC